jgi:hypothetical protein
MSDDTLGVSLHLPMVIGEKILRGIIFEPQLVKN